jgi:hypothetical protein
MGFVSQITIFMPLSAPFESRANIGPLKMLANRPSGSTEAEE